jgi:hypothetical protein
MEAVIEQMLENTTRGYKCTYEDPRYSVASRPILTLLSVLELCRPPDLNEARVRKCILALSGAKIVKSDNSTVRHSYIVPSYESDFDVRGQYCINGLVHQILDDLPCG